MTVNVAGCREADISVEVAINQVLEAEAQALKRVEACQQEAAHIIQEAQKRASRIGAQADIQISDIQKEGAKQTRKQEEELKLESQRKIAFEARSSPSAERLEMAVAKLAAHLTGDPSITPLPRAKR